MSDAHEFDDDGFDLWGYNRGGHYDSRFDRRPFQRSPFPTCADCDDDLDCAARSGA